MHKLNIINPAGVAEAIRKLNCGETSFAKLSNTDFEILYSDIEPSEGYTVPVNPETNAILPNCCKYHKHIFEISQEKFSLFPNCCKNHKKLLQTTWFRKESYSNVSTKVINQLSYTEQHISNRINNDDWYKDITDYIYANIWSFGQLPAGFGSPPGLEIYCSNLSAFVSKKKGVSKEKKEALITFIDKQFGNDNDNKNKNTDLNVLASLYKNWLSIFPFELSYFKELKSHFETRLPLFVGQPEYNKYLKLSKVTPQSKIGLIDFLLNTTNELITQINGSTLYQNGDLNDLDKIKVELVISGRKLKLQGGYLKRYSSDEKQYRAILKEWFKDEKEFINEITQVLNKKDEQTSKSTNRELEFNATYWNKECFDLFNYLIENYSLRAKQKYINVWFFLEYKTDNKYQFNFKQIDYMKYIKKRFRVELKKLNKLSNYDAQMVSLNSLEISYRKSISS